MGLAVESEHWKRGLRCEQSPDKLETPYSGSPPKEVQQSQFNTQSFWPLSTFTLPDMACDFSWPWFCKPGANAALWWRRSCVAGFQGPGWMKPSLCTVKTDNTNGLQIQTAQFGSGPCSAKASYHAFQCLLLARRPVEEASERRLSTDEPRITGVSSLSRETENITSRHAIGHP